jgi:hypothetical protein
MASTEGLHGAVGGDLHDVAHDARTSVLQAGGVVAVAATIVGAALQFTSTQRTADQTIALQSRGQTRNTFQEAISRLGSDANDQAVQLGAVYTLGQLADESHAYQIAVLNILAAYVREHDEYPREPPYRGGPFPLTKVLTLKGEGDGPRTDAVEAALRVLKTEGTADLQGLVLDFTGTNLDDAELEGLTAPGANFEEAHVFFATLTHSYLNLATFDPARMQGTDLSDSCLRKARFGEKTEPQQVISDMKYAYLNRVDAREAVFRFVDMSGAAFADADLAGAVFDHDNLEGANLSHANLAGTRFLDSNLERANLDGASGLTRSQLAAGTTSPGTVLPRFDQGATTEGTDPRPACAGPFTQQTPLPSNVKGR